MIKTKILILLGLLFPLVGFNQLPMDYYELGLNAIAIEKSLGKFFNASDDTLEVEFLTSTKNPYNLRQSKRYFYWNNRIMKCLSIDSIQQKSEITYYDYSGDLLSQIIEMRNGRKDVKFSMRLDSLKGKSCDLIVNEKYNCSLRLDRKGRPKHLVFHAEAKEKRRNFETIFGTNKWLSLDFEDDFEIDWKYRSWIFKRTVIKQQDGFESYTKTLKRKRNGEFISESLVLSYRDNFSRVYEIRNTKDAILVFWNEMEIRITMDGTNSLLFREYDSDEVVKDSIRCIVNRIPGKNPN